MYASNFSEYYVDLIIHSLSKTVIDRECIIYSKYYGVAFVLSVVIYTRLVLTIWTSPNIIDTCLNFRLFILILSNKGPSIVCPSQNQETVFCPSYLHN